MAGVAQPDIHRRFTWQAWHKLTSTVVLRGRRGTDGTGWRPWAGIGRLWRRATLRGRRGTTWHPPSFHVAGVAQSHIYRRFAWQAWDRWHWVAPLGRDWAPVTPRHFAWQAWHNLTSTVVSRGRRGTKSHLPSFCVAGVGQMALGGALGLGLGACDAAPLCVAGVAQPDTHRRFTWQAWHKVTSTVVLRGRRGTDGTGWRPWAGLGRLWRRATLRGRRGTTWHPPSFHVAGEAQSHIYRRFAWQAWDRWHWVAPLGRDWAPVTPRHFAWQAWHNLTSTVVSRGRRGTNSGFSSSRRLRNNTHTNNTHTNLTYNNFTHTNLTHTNLTHTNLTHTNLTDNNFTHTNLTYNNFTHTNLTYTNLTHTNLTHTNLTDNNFTHTNLTYNNFTHTNLTYNNFTHTNLTYTNLTDNHFTHTHTQTPLCVAGVAQPDIHRRFTWQAWHKLTSTVVLRGRRGTDGTGWRPWAGIGRLWRRATLRGRRGTTWHPPSFHVAGVAQTHIYRRFAWQAWDRWHWVAPLGRDWAPVTPRHFAWQAWHNLTSTVVSRGRRGTKSHLPSFCVAGVGQMALGGALGPGLGACDAAPLCVAGVAQPDIHRRFTWQAWHKVTSTIVSFCVAGMAHTHTKAHLVEALIAKT